MKQFLTLMMAGIITLCSVPDLYAGKTTSMRYHNDWQSFILSDNGTANSRMTTHDKNTNVTLSIDFFKNMCGNGIPQLIYNFPGCQKSESPTILYGESRIDEKRTQKIQYSMTTENDFMFIVIAPSDGRRLLREAINGQVLRFKIDLDTGKSVYFRFSLSGFTAAYSRAQDICISSSSNYNDDSRYFEKRPPKVVEPIPDAAYF